MLGYIQFILYIAYALVLIFTLLKEEAKEEAVGGMNHFASS